MLASYYDDGRLTGLVAVNAPRAFTATTRALLADVPDVVPPRYDVGRAQPTVRIEVDRGAERVTQPVAERVPEPRFDSDFDREFDREFEREFDPEFASFADREFERDFERNILGVR